MIRSGLFFLVSTLCVCCGWMTDTHAASFQPQPWDFTAVYKKAAPAVVFIIVEAEAERRAPQSERRTYHDPYDFFGEGFFEQFFRRQQPRQQSQAQRRLRGQGSGFLVSSDGYILTNNHVVRDADLIRCRLHDGRELRAKLIGSDARTDIAVIKVEGSQLPYLELGNSDDLKIGQRVLAIGNPLGLQASASEGILSALGRSGLNITDFEDFLQTDAAINRGNSGGPLIDTDGKVIGINTAIVSGAGGGYMGIGFAIPSSMAQLVMDQLINNGSVTLGYVGMAMQVITPESATVLGLNHTHGVIVHEVAGDSPAADAGILAGDVILRFDGRPIDNPVAFHNRLKLARPGQRMELEIYREGSRKDIVLEIGSLPTEGLLDHEAGAIMGVEVQTLSPELARQLGYQHDRGVVISRVYEGSAADQAQLREGDVILHINQRPVESAQDFYALIRASKKGDRLILTVQQGGVVRFITMTVN